MRMKQHMSAAVLLLAFASCTSITLLPSASAEEAPAARPKYDLGQPYIGGPLPDAQTLVPAAPEGGSATAQSDLADNAAYLAMQNSPRWMMAARDADLSRGWVTRAFSCAAGRKINDEDTPKLAQLLRRAGTDFGMSTSGVKALYQRARPFMVNDAPSCTPQDEDGLRTNGSYPSGHSAIGFGASLVLASVLPEHAAQLVARGRAFGESRAVCNVHWTSDVEESRIVASATFARLMANASFRADLDAARAEMSEVPPADNDASDCAAEAAALAGSS